MIRTPAASAVTAHGRGKRTETLSKPTGAGGREAAAPLLRLGSARFHRPLCKNGDAARGCAPQAVDRGSRSGRPNSAARAYAA